MYSVKYFSQLSHNNLLQLEGSPSESWKFYKLETDYWTILEPDYLYLRVSVGQWSSSLIHTSHSPATMRLGIHGGDPCLCYLLRRGREKDPQEQQGRNGERDMEKDGKRRILDRPRS